MPWTAETAPVEVEQANDDEDIAHEMAPDVRSRALKARRSPYKDWARAHRGQRVVEQESTLEASVA